MEQKQEISFTRLITLSIITKLLADITYQFFNPFLPMVAAGLGSDTVTFGRLITLRNLFSLIAPLFGTLADRVGYRMMIRIGLIMALVGTLLIGSSRGIWLAALAMIVLGASQVCVGPILQAYLSSYLPYNQRGRGIGMLEYSWALTGIVGLSLLGWVIDWTSWRVPFFLLAAGLAVMWWVFGQMPDVRHQKHVEKQSTVQTHPTGLGTWAGVTNFFDLGENGRSAYASILAGGFNYFAASQMMIMYGAWLNDQYGLVAGQLGTVALVLGVFDLLLGSVLVSLFADRIGKRNSVLIGSVISVFGYCLIPFLNVGIIPAVLGMALSRAAFEFAIVSNISLLSEQSPRQRGKTMTLSGAIWQLWGALAGLTAPWLYAHWQIQGIVWVSALCAVCAVITTLLSVREYEEEATINMPQPTING